MLPGSLLNNRGCSLRIHKQKHQETHDKEEEGAFLVTQEPQLGSLMGKIPHAMEQLSQCTATAEPVL